MLRRPNDEVLDRSEEQSIGEVVSDNGSSSPHSRASRVLWRVRGLVRTVRPHQWVKNVFVLAPVVFAKEIFVADLLFHAAAAFAVFCLIAGAVYTINDIADYDADRVHPKKRNRPIASGQLPIPAARIFAGILIAVSFSGAALLSGWFFLITAGYLVLNLAYSTKLKHIAYLDVGCISAGFVMRVFAGGLATDIRVSRYLLLCTALLALFLGLGKRRHELSSSASSLRQRAALEGYSVRGLNLSMYFTGAATVAVYLAYTLDPDTQWFFGTQWLWPTTLLVVLGVWRFAHLVRNRPHTESPTQEMLSDGPMVGIVLVWAALVAVLIYHLQPG